MKRWAMVALLWGCTDAKSTDSGTVVPASTCDITVSGETTPALAEFEATVAAYMETYAIPNGNVALVTASDALILNRSFTNSCGGEIRDDGTVAWTSERTTTASRYRVGSVSKLITATMVHMLVETPGLGMALSDPVVDHLDLAAEADFDGDGTVDVRDSRVPAITLSDSLEHRTGWNCREKGEPHLIGDPSKSDFRIVEAYGSAGTTVTLPIEVRHMLGYTASAPLAWDPGTEQSYCSVGYVMLGAIIAGVTDQPYADAVAAHILGPVGMTATAPGRTLAADRLDGEVTYADHSPALDESVMAEGERASRPYGGAFNLENRLAGGGWVSTAADVVRFGRAFMRGDLTADPAAIMADELGWPDHFAQRDRATGHTGSMEGNHALLMCFGPDDENPVIANACWSFLFNKSPPKDIIDPVTGAEEEPRDILAFALANDVLGALLEL